MSTTTTPPHVHNDDNESEEHTMGAMDFCMMFGVPGITFAGLGIFMYLFGDV